MNMLFQQLKRARAITKKDLKIYFAKGPTLIFGLAIPLFLLMSFIVGRHISIRNLLPGVIGMAVFFTTSAIGPMIAPWETRMKTFERLVSSPIALWAIILGDIIACFLFGAFITFIIILISAILLGANIINLYLIIGTILAAFVFSALGMIISSVPADEPSKIQMLSTLIKYPLIFISGVFVPISSASNIKILHYISPLTYYVDLSRYSIQKINILNPYIDILALILFATLFFMLSVKLHKKSLASRF